MPDQPSSRRSFSTASRWRIGLDQLIRTILVVAVAVMANIITAQYFHRFYLDPQTDSTLSSRSLAILHSVTNQMTITLYYDTHDQENFYSTLAALADEYHFANKNIIVRTVDYNIDAALAEKLKQQYNLPGAAEDPNTPKDLIIFSSGDRPPIIVPGSAIVQYKLEATGKVDPEKKEVEFRKKPVVFNGEIIFTSKLLQLSRAQPFKAYYSRGNGEPALDGTDDTGFSKFALALAQDDVYLNYIQLAGDADIPTDCDLLVIAAPTRALPEVALEKIDKYLSQGGRLFVMFNYASARRPTGLEPILKRWGVNVIPTWVNDPKNSGNSSQVVQVFNFNESAQSFVKPLSQLALEMILPRPIARINWTNAPASAPDVLELAYSGPDSTLEGDPAVARGSYPLMASVEQKPVAGVSNPRGNTHIVITGDSLFLDNQLIDAVANRDFLNHALDWLMDQQQFVGGISAKPVTEFRVNLSGNQGTQLFWLLLGALPGATLMLGWLVWLVRRR